MESYGLRVMFLGIRLKRRGIVMVNLDLLMRFTMIMKESQCIGFYQDQETEEGKLTLNVSRPTESDKVQD